MQTFLEFTNGLVIKTTIFPVLDVANFDQLKRLLPISFLGRRILLENLQLEILFPESFL